MRPLPAPATPPPEKGTTYFVDAARGDDKNDGSQAKPWKTIQHGVKRLKPGETLYLRGGGTQEVFWHGPSVGFDVGGEGSKTLFLIYKLKAPEELYATFTGIDGSAYLVGGVGATLVTNGSVVMAPIRSGIGLRLGASVGYLRFTPKATWNPF